MTQHGRTQRTDEPQSTIPPRQRRSHWGCIATFASLIMLMLVATWNSPESVGADSVPIAAGSISKLTVHPPSIVIDRARDISHIIVTGHDAAGRQQDLTRGAKFTSSDNKVATVDNGVVKPHANGKATIQVSAGDKTVSIPVEVVRYDVHQPVSFAFDTLPALSKQGCNSGACHGSPSGKGGFRLSLRAFDPTIDQLTLIREDFGRRTNALNPADSLLLLKPLMRVPHGGGMKLRTDDPAYRVLADWIAEGCASEKPGEAKCVGIEVFPPSGRVLEAPAHKQQLRVTAKFSDGSVRDVTEFAVFSSSDGEVAAVDRNGLVIGADRGESAIVVRYLEFIESTFITFVKDVEGYVWSKPPVNNYIDTHVHAKLKQLKYLPSATSTDDEFLRRVYLDVIGVLPTIEEVQKFLADKSPNKRAALIDELLERPEFAKFWTLKWGDLLRMTKGQVGPDGVYKYHRWVERAVASNMPYDEFARELLTASGSTLQSPAANFYRTASDANDCVETISQVFLGARLQCAKCHNHPFERWTQDNYYGMAAFFNRVQRQTTARPNEVFIWASSSGEVTQPRTGQTMKPWLPGKGSQDEVDPDDRRQTFADWLTQPENPYFAKIEVNRIWSHLLGRGIVDPPDDFRESNPPSNAALLDALAKDFVEKRFDREHVIRTILNSRTYQSSFRPNAFNVDDRKYSSHYQPRLLAAEQLLDAICHVTNISETFAALPPGTKATQIPAPDLVSHEFLKIFGQPERQTVCLCERSSESNLGMAIQFFNGPLIYNKIRNEQNRFRKMIAASVDDRKIVTQLHLAAVCREPTEKEWRACLAHVSINATEVASANKQIDAEVAAIRQKESALRAGIRAGLLAKKLSAAPEAFRADLAAALKTPKEKRSEVQAYLVGKLGPLVVVTDANVETALTAEQKKSLAADAKRAAELAGSKKTASDSRLIALEDICWALLNTNEFLFNH